MKMNGSRNPIVAPLFCLGFVLQTLVFQTLVFQAGPLAAQRTRNTLSDSYTKNEYKIPMRDGVKLHVSVYSPKDTSQEYPIVLKRTPYSCQPYGRQFAGRIGPSPLMEQEKYIFVHQDVRGRWNSEGSYDNMRPHVDGRLPIDESSDTYDTIEWLLENIPNNNGKVGMWGISYPGFYSAAALPEHHPALVAVSPQAPISDFFFDDFHHQGAYLLSYFFATATFGYQKSEPTTQPWYTTPWPEDRDAYQFFLSMGPLSNADKYYGQDNFFWQQIVDHPNYDEFWQRRSILPHLKGVTANVMTVGGWFDAEDLYGPLNIYKELEKNNPDTFNVLVMGPFSHGAWARGPGVNSVGNIVFGEDLASDYQRQIEAPFFRHFLKGIDSRPDFEAYVFDCGNKKWKTFDAWPPKSAVTTKMYMQSDGSLGLAAPTEKSASKSFVSDPGNPVPYRKREDITMRFTPRPYMSDDQRFASERDDVLVFQTDILQEDVTLVGPITARLKVSTDKTAADWIVKLIDVYPNDTPNDPRMPNVNLGGYQQMVRSEVLRGRFREGHDKAVPFVPNEIASVDVPLQDVFHTFKKGHRIMVHVQSSWFPLIDRNPQTFVDNIFRAKTSDFVKATHTLHLGADQQTHLEVMVLK